MNDCPNCEYHKQQAQLWRDEAYKQAGHPLPEREQEPIGYASEGAAERLTTVKQAHEQIRSFRLFTHDVPLYTAPQRTWVGLTDKEIEAIWEVAMFANYGVGAELSNQPFVHYARAIEAKLKDKNEQTKDT